MQKLFFLVFIYFSFFSNTCLAKDSIIWGIDWSPPINTADISQSGGISGEILGVLERGLPEYTHDHQEMNLLRIMSSLEEQKNVCCNYLFKNPEREKKGYFSLPLRINLPLRIIMRKDAFDDMGQPAVLSIMTLLRDTELRCVFEKGRSYSLLDPIIQQFSKRSNTKVEVINSTQLLKMLDSNRIDFLIDYSYAVSNNSHATQQYNDDQIVFVPIEEIFEYAYSYVICPKNDWGMRVIKDVNRVLRQEVPNESYLEILKSPFKLKQEQLEIDKIYNVHLLKEYESN